MKWENPRKNQITADKDAEIFNEAPVVLMSCFLNALPHLSIQRVSKEQHVPGSSSSCPKQGVLPKFLLWAGLQRLLLPKEQEQRLH